MQVQKVRLQLVTSVCEADATVWVWRWSQASGRHSRLQLQLVRDAPGLAGKSVRSLAANSSMAGLCREVRVRGDGERPMKTRPEQT